jgi:hypothetical protein
MRNILVYLVMGLFLPGCGAATQCVKGASVEKVYSSATPDSKNALHADLRSGKVTLGATLDYIKSSYGDPDSMLIANCTARVIYKLASGRNLTLWFDDGWHLSMWSD